MTSANTKDKRDTSNLDWMYPNPFISQWQIDASHIDHYQHTNNIAYLSRLEQLAWEHSKLLGLTFADYELLDRAMVITQHELNYHLPTHFGDTLACATWIVSCDEKCRLSREFQYIALENERTVFTAKTHFVCVSLKTGMPKKMPQAFKNIYGKVAVNN